MKNARWFIAFVVAGSILTFVYFNGTQTVPPEFKPPATAEPTTPLEPEIRHPLPAPPRAAELPSLNGSDDAITAALRTLWTKGALELFRLNDAIRRVVATVDNLPRPELAERLRPVIRAPGEFRVAGKAGDLTLGVQNFPRYSAYVALARNVDAEKLVAIYVRFYPLFQKAYEELGYPNAYFNDRLVDVIDHLIAAPELPEHTRLVQPKVFYEFADDSLERRSAGEKILMRIGNQNAAVIKAKLREIRAELARKTRSH